MTADEYEQLAGRPPDLDDLERANCALVGMPGHLQCGICHEHQKPRPLCGCIATKWSPNDPKKSKAP